MGESGGGGRIERAEPRPVAAAPPAALPALRPVASNKEDEEPLIDIGVDRIDKEA